MNMQTLALFFLVTLAAGGVAWVFVYPILSGERNAEKRQERIARTEPAVRAASSRSTPKVRREQIEDTLKELEVRNKKQKSIPLPMRISQAGLDWSKRKFIVCSVGVGAALFVAAFFVSGNPLIALSAGFAGGFGAPRWMLAFLKKRREGQFLYNF